MKTLAAVIAACVSLSGGALAQAPNWPTQPIRIVVPSAAGGTTDFLARVSGEFLSSRLGQPVIIENNTGAGGNVGTAMVARAAPDGHTLGFISTNNLAINQFLFKSLPYDPLKDLTPVAIVAEAPQILVVSKNVPAQNLKEFIALLKAKPNSLNYASAGPGTTPHLAAVQFMRLADVQMTHVPYRGAAPAVTDLASGQVQCSPSARRRLRASWRRATCARWPPPQSRACRCCRTCRQPPKQACPALNRQHGLGLWRRQRRRRLSSSG